MLHIFKDSVPEQVEGETELTWVHLENGHYHGDCNGGGISVEFIITAINLNRVSVMTEDY